MFDRPTYETQITEEDDRNLPKRVLQVIADLSLQKDLKKIGLFGQKLIFLFRRLLRGAVGLVSNFWRLSVKDFGSLGSCRRRANVDFRFRRFFSFGVFRRLVCFF